MKLLKEQDGDQLRLECIGKLDAVSAPVFREEISKTDLTPFNKIILDFENVPYISSAGLRELLIVKKKLRPGVPLHIRNASEEVAEIFEMTGFADYLVIERADAAADVSEMSLPPSLPGSSSRTGSSFTTPSPPCPTARWTA